MNDKKLSGLSLVSGIFVFLQIILAPSSIFCGQIGMVWDESMEPGVDGYRVFCREEDETYDYGLPSWESTDSRSVITELDEDTTYYAVVRAYNDEGIESDDSNEVSFQPCESYPLLSENYFYDIVMEGDTVILDHIDNLEKDYTITSYNWAQLEGYPVALSDPAAASPSFTAPDVDEDVAELKFVVGIKSTDGLCDAAEVVIEVESDSYRSAASDGGGSSGGCFMLTCPPPSNPF